MSVDAETALEIGQLTPDFTLENQHGESVTLSDFRGRKNVVLMFYPAAFTGICTSELGGLRDRVAEFEKADAVVLGISCDRVPSLNIYAAQEGIGYSLLSDFWPHGDVARAYGVFLESHGIATRATFVLDQAGVLRWSLINGPGEPRDVGDVIAAVTALAEAS